MFDAEQLRTFLIEYEDKLQAAVEAYFDDLAQADAPKTGLARLLQPANAAITRLIARQTIAETLRELLRAMHFKAAVIGNGSQGIDAGQHMAALDAIDEQLVYLDGYLKDLPGMTRTQALDRIVKYVLPAVQTISDSMTVHLPNLPHYPGDRDLACHGFCRCHLEVKRLGPNDWDVFWFLDAEGVEHCPDCVELAFAWSPLKIRDGQIIYETLKHKNDEGETDALED